MTDTPIVCNLPDILPEAEQVLLKHGCTIEAARNYKRVKLPIGTSRSVDTFNAPYVAEPRYWLSLPSGLQIIQIELRNREGYKDLYGDLQMSQLLISKGDYKGGSIFR